MRWSVNDRALIVRAYYEARGDVRETRRALSAARPDRRPPSGRTIRAIVNKFEGDGTVADRARAGRTRLATSDAMVAAVSDSVRLEPMMSTRKRASRLGVSAASVHRVLRERLALHPYKIQIAHHAKQPMDSEARLAYARAILALAVRYPREIPTLLVTTDEAHFHLTGEVFNRHNIRFWSERNPRVFRQKDPYSPRLTVWCGVTALGILGPYFYAEDTGGGGAGMDVGGGGGGRTVSVTGERYRAMLRDYVFPELRGDGDPRYSGHVGEWWWQQDGATAHTARETMKMLREEFGAERVISGRGVARAERDGVGITWPSRSPDLSPPDFFLWGFLKERVYDVESETKRVVDAAAVATAAVVPPPPAAFTLDRLRANIKREVANLNEPEWAETLRLIAEETLVRARLCVREHGGHLRDVIFRT